MCVCRLVMLTGFLLLYLCVCKYKGKQEVCIEMSILLISLIAHETKIKSLKASSSDFSSSKVSALTMHFRLIDALNFMIFLLSSSSSSRICPKKDFNANVELGTLPASTSVLV